MPFTALAVADKVRLYAHFPLEGSTISKMMDAKPMTILRPTTMANSAYVQNRTLSFVKYLSEKTKYTKRLATNIPTIWILTSFNAALSVTSSYISLPRPFMACPTLYIHLGTSRPSRTATTRRIYKNTVKDKVRPAIIKNPRLERKKFIILTSTLTIYPVIQDITKSPIVSLPARRLPQA